jgi:AcrR family transcriptional regulator
MTNQERTATAGRGAVTRRKIAAAAVELVAELGWDAVTTRAVAARAGVNPALVHYHFGSMETLLRDAVVAVLEEEIGQAAQPLAQAPSLAAGIAGAVDAIAGFDPDTPAANLLIEAMVRAMRDPGLAGVIVASLQAFRDLVAGRVRAAAAAGETNADLSPEGMGVLIAAALDGLLFHRVIDHSTDVAGVRDVLLRLVTDPAHVAGPAGPPDPIAPPRGGTP